MAKARLVITAVVVEKRPVAEVVAQYGVARSWVYELLARYRIEGEAAFVPRSRRPKTSPRATAAATVELVLRLRKQLSEQDLDARSCSPRSGKPLCSMGPGLDIDRQRNGLHHPVVRREGGRNGLETELRKLNITQKNSRPNHPTTCGNGRLHHIGIGRTHARTHVLILVHDLQIRVVDAATGEFLRELVLDPDRDYQPTGRPPGPIPKRSR